MRVNKEFRFFAEDFWNLITAQKYTCALTGRELTPVNTEVELRRPKISAGEGRADLANHYLVDKDISHICRHLSEEEVIGLAIEIVRHRGREHGYTLRKVKPS